MAAAATNWLKSESRITLLIVDTAADPCIQALNA